MKSEKSGNFFLNFWCEPWIIYLYTRCHRDSSSSPEDREEEAMLCEDEDYPETTTPEKSATQGVMNEHMAAMVLTALSCSPVSPGPYPTVLTEKGMDDLS